MECLSKEPEHEGKPATNDDESDMRLNSGCHDKTKSDKEDGNTRSILMQCREESSISVHVDEQQHQLNRLDHPLELANTHTPLPYELKKTGLTERRREESNTNSHKRDFNEVNLLYHDENTKSSRSSFSNVKGRRFRTSSTAEQFYHRRHYVVSPVEDNLEETQSIKRARVACVSSSPLESHTNQSDDKLAINFHKDLIQPLQLTISRLFSRIHQAIISYDGDNEKIQTERIKTLAECCEAVLLTQRQLIEQQGPRNHFSTSDLSAFTLSHSLLDLYSLLWYSPSIASYAEHEISDFTNDNWLSPIVLNSAISQVKCRLLLWYIKHSGPIPPHRSAEQIMRSIEIFDFGTSNPPPIVFEETSNHLARLLLLCHFDEFFHMLYLIGTQNDPTAQLLADALLNSNLVKSPSRYRLNLLDPKRHSNFLIAVRQSINSVMKSTILEPRTNHQSVFHKCVDLFIGDELKIDKVIYEVFPNSWLASFVLGFFWRSFSETLMLEDFCQTLSPILQDLGDIVEYFFKNWVEGHPSFFEPAKLKSDDQPIFALLSNDTRQLIDYLLKNSSLLISPLLAHFISYDEPFYHEERIKAEIYLKHAASLSDHPVLAFPYTMQTLIEAHHEIRRKQHNMYSGGSYSYSVTDAISTATRSSRYAVEAGDEDSSVQQTRYSKDESLDELSETLLGIIANENVEDMGKENEGQEQEKNYRNGDGQQPYLLYNAVLEPSDFAFWYKDIPTNKSAKTMALCFLVRSLLHCCRFDQFMSLLDLCNLVIVNEPLSDLIELSEILQELIEKLVKYCCSSNNALDALLFAFLYGSIKLQISCLTEAQSRQYVYLHQFIYDGENASVSDPLERLATRHHDLLHNQKDPSLHLSWRSVLVDLFGERSISSKVRSDTSRLIDYVLDSMPKTFLLATLKNPHVIELLHTQLTLSVASTRFAFLVKFARHQTVIEFMTNQLALANTNDQISSFSRTHPPKLRNEIEELELATEWMLKFICTLSIPLTYIEHIFDFLLSVILCSPCVISSRQLEEFTSFWSGYRSGMYQHDLSVPASCCWSPLCKARIRRMSQAISNLQLEFNLIKSPVSGFSSKTPFPGCPDSMDLWMLQLLAPLDGSALVY